MLSFRQHLRSAMLNFLQRLRSALLNFLQRLRSAALSSGSAGLQASVYAHPSS
jgi:hypothetical protein